MGYSIDAQLSYCVEIDESIDTSDFRSDNCEIVYRGDLTRMAWDYLAVKESIQDGPILDISKIVTQPQWDLWLEKACRDLGVKYSQPKWRILATYG